MPDWPGWCLLPMAAWQVIVAKELEQEGRPDTMVPTEAARLAAIATWRYSQGIYRIDPDMLVALADTPFNGELPADLLMRLPEWSIYVETPGLHWMDEPLHGFWAHLEADVEEDRQELRFLLDSDVVLAPMVLPLGDWTIEEAIERSLRNEVDGGDQSPQKSAVKDWAADMITPLVSLLLYLCSDAPDIDSPLTFGSKPTRPVLKKTRRGYRLFPAQNAYIHKVGMEAGRALRAAGTYEPGAGISRRPHFRRGHWHGFWTGPGRQVFIVKWISPLIVQGARDLGPG